MSLKQDLRSRSRSWIKRSAVLAAGFGFAASSVLLASCFHLYNQTLSDKVTIYDSTLFQTTLNQFDSSKWKFSDTSYPVQKPLIELTKVKIKKGLVKVELPKIDYIFFDSEDLSLSALQKEVSFTNEREIHHFLRARFYTPIDVLKAEYSNKQDGSKFISLKYQPKSLNSKITHAVKSKMDTHVVDIQKIRDQINQEARQESKNEIKANMDIQYAQNSMIQEKAVDDFSSAPLTYSDVVDIFVNQKEIKGKSFKFNETSKPDLQVQAPVQTPDFKPQFVLSLYTPSVAQPSAQTSVVATSKKQSNENTQASVPTQNQLAIQSPKPDAVQMTNQAMKVTDTDSKKDYPNANSNGYSGRITEAFTNGTKSIEGVSIQVLGTNMVTQTNASGEFSFSPDLLVDGVLPVVISKFGYLKRRVELNSIKSAEIELVSENSLSLTAMALGLNSQNVNSYLFGQITSPTGESLAGLKVQLISGDVVSEPNYLDNNGIPNSKLLVTSERGQFVALNLVPGTYLVVVTDAFGNERAPHLLHVSANEGIVRKFSTGERRYIRGTVFNATGSAASNGLRVDRAKVRMLGSEKVYEANKDGEFIAGPLYVDCSEVNYLQFDKSGFYRNRVSYSCSNDQNVNSAYYVFPSSYVDALGTESGMALNSSAGVVVGHTNFNFSVKMQLWGPDEVNPTDSIRGKDFYFDRDGVLNRELNRTTRNGNFSILDAPEGLSYVQSFSKNNKTLSYYPIYLSPSTVSTYIQ